MRVRNITTGTTLESENEMVVAMWTDNPNFEVVAVAPVAAKPPPDDAPKSRKKKEVEPDAEKDRDAERQDND